MIDLQTIPFIAALIALIFGSITDLKVREVPDFLNFGLIAFGFFLSIIASIISGSYTPILFSAAGFAIGLIIGLLMYYTGQWGGGDTKLLMAIGATLGLNPFIMHLQPPYPFLIEFMINILFCGAAYGLLWSIGLAIKNRKTFFSEFKKIWESSTVRKMKFTVAGIAIIGFIFAVINTPFRFFIIALAVGSILLFYLWVFVKVMEKSCMFKEILPEKLTEGDWILRDVIVKGKTIASPKDLGVSKEQIAVLISLHKQKKIKTVWIKEGVPFVPSFLFAFIVTYFFPAWYVLSWRLI